MAALLLGNNLLSEQMKEFTKTHESDCSHSRSPLQQNFWGMIMLSPINLVNPTKLQMHYPREKILS